MSNPQASTMVLTDENGERGAVISPCASNAGMWRLTRFDDRGFAGHEEHANRDNAIRSAHKSHRFTTPMSEQDFNAMAATDRFMAGNELSHYVQKRDLTPEDLRRINELNRIIAGA